MGSRNATPATAQANAASATELGEFNPARKISIGTVYVNSLVPVLKEIGDTI